MLGVKKMGDQTIPRRPVPEISQVREEDIIYDERPKHEDSSYSIPKPPKSKTRLSWRTRFTGGGRSTLDVSEVNKNGKYSYFLSG